MNHQWLAVIVMLLSFTAGWSAHALRVTADQMRNEP